MPANEYQRPKDAIHLQFNGINIRLPVDRLPPSKYPYAQNVRNYLGEAVISRPPQTVNLLPSTLPSPVRSLLRIYTVPSDGIYAYLMLSGRNIYIFGGFTVTAPIGGSSLSGFPVSMVAFRPNASIAPWIYVCDTGYNSKYTYLPNGPFGQLMGVAEPQLPPVPVIGAAGGPTGTYVYYGVFRSAPIGLVSFQATGALSNPSPVSAQISPSNQAVNLTIPATFNTKQGVDACDYYRQSVGGGGLPNPTYVGTGFGTGFPFIDTLTDLDVAANPIMQFDNFEPFPSIGFPFSDSGTWTNGSPFGQYVTSGSIVFPSNLAPGTTVLINAPGVPNTVVATLYNRPPSITTLNLVLAPGYSLPNGPVNISVAEPILLAQGVASLWGPTDNAAFFFGCGDPLRPGTLYWTKGNNPDSAPDTNQQEVTAPSEPLMNGVIVNGLGMVFSTERAWLIYPNFFSALATVIGTVGQQWFLIEAIATRGLFAPQAICTDGGGNVYFRSKDGIYLSPGGHGAQSITDDDLYSLFPHESTAGQDYSITVAATTYTVFAPDPAQSKYETMAISNGFLYWDYIDTHGTQRTLVYDTHTNGWVPDIYAVPAACHSAEVGALTEHGTVTQVILGCTDGTVRDFAANGTETGTAVLLTNCFNAGDARADKRFGDVFLDAALPASLTVQVASDLFESFFSPATVIPAATAARARYVVDIPHQSSEGDALWDIELVMSWALGSGNAIYVWQPSLVPMPETIQARPTDWDDAGTLDNKFFQGVIVEADTFGFTKSVAVEDDAGGIHALNETFNFIGQAAMAFSFNRPFISHLVRFSPQDSLKWRLWGLKWVFVPYPELCQLWQTEGMSHGLIGWQHIREMNIAYLSASPLTVTLTPDYGPPIVLTVPVSAVQTKAKITVPVNKFKIVSYQITSTGSFYLWEKDCEVKVGQWGRQDSYRILRPFGGQSAMRAEV